MRKLSQSLMLVLALSLLAVPAARAQGVLVGVKAGFISANVDEDGADARNAAAFGGLLRFGMGPLFSFQPEALYVQKGFSSETVDGDGTFELDYLQVPLLLQLHFPVDAGVSPYVYAGPTLALELGCSISGTSEGVSASMDCDALEDLGFDFESKSVEFGMVLGGGVDLPAGLIQLMFDGRYALGMSDILEIEGVSGLKNRSWELYAGAGIPLGL